VGITATGRGELVFDTSRGSRKYRNLSSYAQIALVVGWENEMTCSVRGSPTFRRALTVIAVWRPTSLSTRTVWNAPMITTLCTSGYAKLAALQRLPARVLYPGGDHLELTRMGPRGVAGHQRHRGCAQSPTEPNLGLDLFCGAGYMVSRQGELDVVPGWR
jgi:hypothetical protein